MRRSRVPARVAHRLWQQRFTGLDRLIVGSVDVVHGPNFTAPPTTSLGHHCPGSFLGPLPAMVSARSSRHGRSRCKPPSTLERRYTYRQWPSPAMYAPISVCQKSKLRWFLYGVSPIVAGDAAQREGVLLGHEKYVLILGTVEHRKNVAAVADSLSSLPNDVALVVAAGPPGNAESTLGGAARRLQIREAHCS